jgi:hypothetical protein
MRKSVVAVLLLVFVLGGIPGPAYAVDCTKDTLADKFGDWFGNLGKKEKAKERHIAARKANRLADCTEKEAKKIRG